MALQDEWTPERFLNEKVKPHYEDLAGQFNTGKLDPVWFEKKYRKKARLHDRAQGRSHQGAEEIHKFWKDLRDASTGDISFDLRPENIRIFPVDLRSPHPGGSNVVIHVGVVFAGYQVGRAAADPPLECLWLHWEDCSWEPEFEDVGR